MVGFNHLFHIVVTFLLLQLHANNPLVHHELEVVYDDGCLSEQHTATLLVLGETHYWDTELLQRPQSVMPHTVGLLPAAIAAKVILDTLTQ